MKTVCALVTSLVLLLLLGTEGQALRLTGDVSGVAMQRFNSQMLSSPVADYNGLVGRSFWPWVNFPQAPTVTIENVEIERPDSERTIASPSTPPANAKFWTARCGIFVELRVSPAMNLMQEEQKPCPQ